MQHKIPFHLNLTKQWFNLIQSRIKTEEYRKITDHWRSRLCTKRGFKIKNDWYKPDDVVIIFSNGYAKTSPQFKAYPKALRIGTGKEEWGAIKGQPYFIIELQIKAQ